MDVQRFSLETYLRVGDPCHVARKRLAPRWPDRAHDHDYYEVFLIEAGEADHWINGQMERLRPGHLAFIRPSDAHAFRADPNLGCRILNVMFQIETAAHFRARYATEVADRFFDVDGGMPDTHFLRGARLERGVQVFQDLANGPPSRARLDAFLLTLMTKVVSPLSDLESKGPKWLAEACDAARDPAVFRQGATGFIAVSGRSHEHVCRTCREVLGLTPSAFINRVRTEYAADRLARSNDPIPEIAAQCGIENVSHFYRVFRTHQGTTPRAYRATHQRLPF